MSGGNERDGNYPVRADMSYWEVRGAILQALRTNNDEQLADLIRIYPLHAKNIINQAKNASRRGQKCL